MLHQGFCTLSLCPLRPSQRQSKKSESVTLSEEALQLYRTLIDAATTAPVLVPANFNKPFCLETDATKKELGAVLMQVWSVDNKLHPIGFGCTVLKGSQQKYHSSKLKFYALHWTVTKQFSKYLHYALAFTVQMDNNPLTYVLTTAKLDTVGHCWVADLASYHFTLKYVRGRDNTIADCLSRNLPKPDEVQDEMVFMDEETVKEALSGAELRTGHRALLHDPLLVHLHQSIGEEI